MSAISTWVMGTLFRWLPHRASRGLRAVGAPGPDSPVLVTGNYRLTLARLLKHLKSFDVWLLVADSGGINVWCAACGGIFTDHQVISAVKTSGIAEKVRHRLLVLPPLSAPGMDTARIREETGFRVLFGPVHAADLPSYLQHRRRKTEESKRADFGLTHRLDMLVSMNFVIWLLPAPAFFFFWPGQLLHFTIWFWGLAAFLYLFFPWIPGTAGWGKTTATAVLVIFVCVVAGLINGIGVLGYRYWMAGGVVMTLVIGFDLAGIVGPMPSEAEAFLDKYGLKHLGFLFKERELGHVALYSDRCIGCYPICNDICPIGVFSFDRASGKAIQAHPDLCFTCRACVKQCPTSALTFEARQ